MRYHTLGQFTGERTMYLTCAAATHCVVHDRSTDVTSPFAASWYVPYPIFEVFKLGFFGKACRKKCQAQNPKMMIEG